MYTKLQLTLSLHLRLLKPTQTRCCGHVLCVRSFIYSSIHVLKLSYIASFNLQLRLIDGAESLSAWFPLASQVTHMNFSGLWSNTKLPLSQHDYSWIRSKCFILWVPKNAALVVQNAFETTAWVRRTQLCKQYLGCLGFFDIECNTNNCQQQ